MFWLTPHFFLLLAYHPLSWYSLFHNFDRHFRTTLGDFSLLFSYYFHTISLLFSYYFHIFYILFTLFAFYLMFSLVLCFFRLIPLSLISAFILYSLQLSLAISYSHIPMVYDCYAMDRCLQSFRESFATYIVLPPALNIVDSLLLGSKKV